MGFFIFWDEYLRALDKFHKGEIQEATGSIETPPKLDRELKLSAFQQLLVSRFFSAIKRMPKAWNAKPWTDKEMNQARERVANDQFHKKQLRDLGLR